MCRHRSQAQAEAGREAALGRLLPLQLSLNSLQARAERLASVLEEVLENEEDVADLCLSAQSEVRLWEQEEGDEAEEGEEEETKRRKAAEKLEDEQELVARTARSIL